MAINMTGTQGLSMTNASPEYFGADSTTWSMSGWFKRSGSHTQPAYILVQADSDSAAIRMGFYTSNTGKLSFRYNHSGLSINVTMADLGTMTIDEWIFAVVVRNGTNISVYVGDQSDAAAGTATIVATASSALDSMYVGLTSLASTEGFNGSVAYAACFNYALSAAERHQLWNGGYAAREPVVSLPRPPVFFADLNDATPEFRYKFFYSTTGSPTYTANSTEFTWAQDPYRLSNSLITDISGCIAHWDFQDAIPGDPDDYSATEHVNGWHAIYDTETGVNPASSLLRRVGHGIFGPYSLRLESGLYVPESGVSPRPIDLAGATHATLLSWVRPWRVYTASGDVQMGFIHGRWGEQGGAEGVRQIANFIGLNDAPNLEGDVVPVMPLTNNTHVSDDGGLTPDQSFNYDVSASGIPMMEGGPWQFLACVWKDGNAYSYVNGALVGGWRNPWAPGFTQLYEATGEPWRFGGVIVSGGSSWGNNAKCDIGGASVFNRALTDVEIGAIAAGVSP
jgi:hypothetical protein